MERNVEVCVLKTLSSLFFPFLLYSKQQRDNDSISGESGDEVDPFNDPDDKWEKDFKLDSGTNRYMWLLSFKAIFKAVIIVVC